MSQSSTIVAQNGHKTDVQTDPEVVPKAKRRTFSAAYKRHILEEADRCTERGQVGALLRREGLYSSHLTDWRREREAGRLNGSTDQRRGRKPRQSAAEKENARLQRENERLRQQLAQANLIIDAQKKLAQVLAQTLVTPGEGQR